MSHVECVCLSVFWEPAEKAELMEMQFSGGWLMWAQGIVGSMSNDSIHHHNGWQDHYAAFCQNSCTTFINISIPLGIGRLWKDDVQWLIFVGWHRYIALTILVWWWSSKVSTRVHWRNLKADWIYSTKQMMTQSYGWNLQRLQHSQNEMNPKCGKPPPIIPQWAGNWQRGR